MQANVVRLLAIGVLSLTLSAQETSRPLDTYVIDVDGGESTLFVSPSGESMLVDAGWPGLEGRDAGRIAAVAHRAGAQWIDHLVMTHSRGQESPHPTTDKKAPSCLSVFRDARGRLLTAEELQAQAGKIRLTYEGYGDWSVTPEAKALHEQGRTAGGRLDLDQALSLFTRAAELAPRWPYPVYDRAYTHLLKKDFEAALADYKKTTELAPRGFFTALTAVDTLSREETGEFPRGLYLAYMMLEPITDRTERRFLIQQLVDKFPQFAPAWQQFANLSETATERLKTIEQGLQAKPDPQTKGTLLLNKALALHDSGDCDSAVALLGRLATDPESTLATEALAKTMLQLVSK